MFTRVPGWLSRLRKASSARESAQVIVLFAVFLIVLLVLAGSAYDYASIVVDDARLQNAVDAASLSASNALALNVQQPVLTQEALAQAAAVAYLAQDGVATATPGTNIVIAFPSSTPVGVNPPSAIIENLTLTATRKHPTSFWPLIGINNVNIQGVGAAGAARSMLDVMLTLDTTGSLVQSSNLYDYTTGSGGTTIVDASKAFIDAMITSADPRGPKVGIARYAGVRCTWVDANSDGNMDTYTATLPVSEYRAPCTDDETVLTPLINSLTTLEVVAAGGAGCPATAATYGCPIQHVPYIIPGSGALQLNGTTWISAAPYYTGTKEPNALCVVNPADALCTQNPASVTARGFAWSTANGARNCASWPCPAGTSSSQARRVQIIMTDGQNEAWPTSNVAPGVLDPAFPETVCCGPLSYDGKFKTLSNNLKANPAPDGGPPVEIYVVGYFCATGSYSSTSFPPGNFCASKLAYTSSSPIPRACPGSSYTPGTIGSPTDDLLVSVSSSTPGTCDHYFPMPKNESLLALFADLAGTISRARLTQ